jgi:hypothetical protein
MLKQLQTNPFFIKLFHKEFWPMWATYLPVFPYYLFLAARARSFFFFTAANPSIETGGMLGEAKINILNMIADEYKPISLLIPANTPIENVLAMMQQYRVNFPIVVKPNIGERGLLVEKITDTPSLEKHIHKNDIDYIIQPFISYDEEYAVMYYRIPNQKRGKIISVCQKKFLSVKGNGKSTVQELIWQQPRAILQWDKLKKNFSADLSKVLANGETLELEVIGNHCRGTTFLNANHEINPELELVFDKITNHMNDVYFGRYDLKCLSMSEMKKGNHIQIMEFNGVGAEPAHIYDPNYPLWKIWRDLLSQWSILFKIGTYVHKHHKVPYMSLKEMRLYWKNLTAYNAGLK